MAGLLSPGLARLSLDYKKARDEYAEGVEPIIRIFGLNEGPFKEDQGRLIIAGAPWLFWPISFQLWFFVGLFLSSSSHLVTWTWRLLIWFMA